MHLLFSPSMSSVSSLTILLLFVLSCFTGFTSTDAYDALDPTGNITIRWDIFSWTPDGYVAVVNIFNYQQYRHIEAPGWSLEWTWGKNEVIWDMMGAQTTEQGDCSRFRGNIPHSCQKSPTVVDLLPGTPYNQQVANCCKGGEISSLAQDPANALSSFQITVGLAGTNSRTVGLPKNFTLKAPGPGYTCGPAKIVKPTRFLSADKRRLTQALMTWNVTCTYSRFLEHKSPACCVSLSSYYNNTIVPCPECSCSCRSNKTHSGDCLDPKRNFPSVISSSRTKRRTPIVECTRHMCPIRVNWHVNRNYKDYWRVKITITNYYHHMNYTNWNLLVIHPNFDNLTQIYGFKYKLLTPQEGINETALLWGAKFRNDLLMQAGPSGSVHSELLFRKDKATSTSKKGWAFPRSIYFNGDSCTMPPVDKYPLVPK